jgi:hypothetical protein
VTKRDREAERLATERQAAEDKRIAAQRVAFAAIPDGPAKQAFRLAALERAFELFDVGSEGCYASDALLEFMAEKDQRALLERFFETQEEFDAAQFPAPAYAAFGETGGLPRYAFAHGRAYSVGSLPCPGAPAFRRIDWKIRARRQRRKVYTAYASRGTFR